MINYRTSTSKMKHPVRVESSVRSDSVFKSLCFFANSRVGNGPCKQSKCELAKVMAKISRSRSRTLHLGSFLKPALPESLPQRFQFNLSKVGPRPGDFLLNFLDDQKVR